MEILINLFIAAGEVINFFNFQFYLDSMCLYG